jgi:nucleoside diphosphate kinase
MGGAWSCGLSEYDWSRMTCTPSAEPDAENCALVFIKPRAFTPAVVALVSERLSRGGLRVVESGTISAEEIQRRGLVDKHYASISTKATKLHPRELQVPPELFAAKFGVRWADVLRAGSAMSASEACGRFGWSEDQLSARWDIALWRDQVAHLGAGLYIGRLDLEAGEIYVVSGEGAWPAPPCILPTRPGAFLPSDPFASFCHPPPSPPTPHTHRAFEHPALPTPLLPPLQVNGFYHRLRRSFTSDGRALQWYVVHFDASELPWSQFRRDILGATDPAAAPVDSLRGTIFAHWRELGMAQEPSVEGNAVRGGMEGSKGIGDSVLRGWQGGMSRARRAMR